MFWTVNPIEAMKQDHACLLDVAAVNQKMLAHALHEARSELEIKNGYFNTNEPCWEELLFLHNLC